MKTKRLASDFPKIPPEKLKLIIETCRLPRKVQNLPERARNARILAMRMRTDQANQKHTKADVTAPGSSWENVIDYLTAGLKEGDFSVLDHFCEGWIQTRAEARILVAKAITFNGEAQPDAPVILSRPVNDPGLKMSIEIAGAILALQRDLDRPPYPQEVIDSCNDPKRGLAVASVCNTDVSEFLTRWKLKGTLPDKRKNPL
jgi:hypothetical protein